MTFRVGLIGCGAMGTEHGRIIAEHVPGARVSRVFDQNADRARAVAALTGGTVTDSVEAILRAPDIDGVVIASPDGTHPELALACIDLGLPALCEKPLAATSEQAWRVVEREAAAGQRFIQLGFMRRYDPGFLQLRRVVTDGRLGQPLLAHCIHRNPSSRTSDTDAGIITGSMIHEFDTVPWVLNTKVRSVRVESPRASALRDPQLAWLYLESGAMSTVEVFVNATYGYDVQCEVVGSGGAASLPARPEISTRTPGLHAQPIGQSFVSHFADAYHRQMLDWVSRRGTVPDGSASAWDGFIATLVAETAIEALTSGGRRDVPLVQRPSLYGSAKQAAHV